MKLTFPLGEKFNTRLKYEALIEIPRRRRRRAPSPLTITCVTVAANLRMAFARFARSAHLLPCAEKLRAVQTAIQRASFGAALSFSAPFVLLVNIPRAHVPPIIGEGETAYLISRISR